MGVVYLGVAWDGSQVAVKLLRTELADDPEFRARFRREVATLARVRGPCTVQVIEADTDSSRPFLVTDHAAGPSLAEQIDAYGPLSADMLYGLATGLAEALLPRPWTPPPSPGPALRSGRRASWLPSRSWAGQARPRLSIGQLPRAPDWSVASASTRAPGGWLTSGAGRDHRLAGRAHRLSLAMPASSADRARCKRVKAEVHRVVVQVIGRMP